ncbi:adenylate/guanylate cyclase domain-containing protein [Marinilabiliaceae bacterium ANBcel2]|nr:adenylate/guanylate cyclase domain-containing protein [Marinilabiliaceae bacterium ANBcel2]
MKIYNDYLDTIKSAIDRDKSAQGLFSGISESDSRLEKGVQSLMLHREIPDNRLLPSLDELAKELGAKPNFDQQLGMHPDFAHLKNTNKYEKHYIVSGFIDIKGSTRLFARYKPETVLVITNTIQKAAIHTCLIFGGYVHRLHGDGLFVYFGGKNKCIKSSVYDILQCVSVFTYFVKNDLRNLFEAQGIEKIYTRIGIDLGYDKDLVWSMAGIGETSEVTTCSLHTNLASKMQASAESNGIVIGQNIKDNLTSEDRDLFQSVNIRTGNVNDRYIYSDVDAKIFYTQYDFNWLIFLKRQSFIVSDPVGEIWIKQSNVRDRNIEQIAPIASLNKPYFDGKQTQI